MNQASDNKQLETPAQHLKALNQLLRLLSRSLPMYLKDAWPWTPPGHEAAASALKQLASDQSHYAQRVAEAIAARDGRPDPGCFPLEYTALNDLSVQRAIELACRHQHSQVQQLALCRQQLASAPELHELAEQICSNAVRHLETLERLVEQYRL